jgi:hypothetical protein
VVCDEDVYFRELVWYIHLNPLGIEGESEMESTSDEAERVKEKN